MMSLEGHQLSLDGAITPFCLSDELSFIHRIIISDVIIEINALD